MDHVTAILHRIDAGIGNFIGNFFPPPISTVPGYARLNNKCSKYLDSVAARV